MCRGDNRNVAPASRPAVARTSPSALGEAGFSTGLVVNPVNPMGLRFQEMTERGSGDPRYSQPGGRRYRVIVVSLQGDCRFGGWPRSAYRPTKLNWVPQVWISDLVDHESRPSVFPSQPSP